jgi:hypothetical protein
MIKFLLVLITLVPLVVSANAQCPAHLFNISKSDNTNVLYYDAKFSGEQLASNPVDIYWVMYAEKGQRESLTFLEKPHFDVKIKEIVKGKEYVINIRDSNVKDRDIKISIDESGCAVATAVIENQAAFLDEIFIQIDPKSKLLPDVMYLDVNGTNTNGDKVSERVYNN